MTTKRQNDRQEVRQTRKGRMRAAAQFVSALGFNPDDVRSFSLIDGTIRLNLFSRDENGTKVTIRDNNGVEAVATYEVNLLTSVADLDADAQYEGELEEAGVEVVEEATLAKQLGIKPEDRDAFGQVLNQL